MNEENEIGYEPDSPISTHPHLYFVAMANRIPRDNTDDEEGEEPPPKHWGETDPEDFNDNPQNTPPPPDQETKDGRAEQAAPTASANKKDKENRPQLLVWRGITQRRNIQIKAILLVQIESTTEKA
jgi:hypothetical protein